MDVLEHLNKYGEVNLDIGTLKTLKKFSMQRIKYAQDVCDDLIPHITTAKLEGKGSVFETDYRTFKKIVRENECALKRIETEVKVRKFAVSITDRIEY